MKSLLWIVNSILALIFTGIFVFIMFSLRNIFEKPTLTPLKVSAKVEPVKKEVVKPQDIKLIYEQNDLFGTYRPSIVSVKPEVEELPPIPQPPMPRPVMPQPQPFIQFLEPLPVKITGIIASNNDAKSQVTLINNNTRKSESYRIGDKLFDAFIVRIFPRKIQVIRSNGQQETLFMYQDEAQTALRELQEPQWSEVIQKQNESAYLINPSAFGSKITSLAQLIDMLDLFIATRNGKNTGIKIGNMKHTSIGYALGFQPGDVIVKIRNITPASTKERLKLYNEIVKLDIGELIPVQIKRRGQIRTHNYTLFNFADSSALELFPSVGAAQRGAQPQAGALPMTSAGQMMPSAPAAQPQSLQQGVTPGSPIASEEESFASEGPPASDTTTGGGFAPTSTGTSTAQSAPTQLAYDSRAQHRYLTQQQPNYRSPVQSIRKQERAAMNSYGSRKSMLMNPQKI